MIDFKDKALCTNAGMARQVAAEDLNPRDYIAILRTVNEWMPLFSAGEEWAGRSRPQRLVWLPDDDELDAMRVVSISLPYVLVAKPDGSHKTLDTRQVWLARLPAAFGRKAFRCLKPIEKERKKSRRRRRKKTSA